MIKKRCINLQLVYNVVLGHVIPAEHLLSVALDRGPSGKELDFTYQSRDSAQLVRLRLWFLALWESET